MTNKSVTKEVRHYLLALAEDIATDLQSLPNGMEHTDEYRATKELVTTLRRAADDYRYKKLVKPNPDIGTSVSN